MVTTQRPGGTPKTPRRAASSRAGSPVSERPRATRPAAAARGRRPSEELRTPRSIKGLAILGFIFVMLAVTLIPALRSTINQQRQISELTGQLAQKRETVAALEREQLQWQDPAFVEQQARERLKFVRVGEKSYTVIDADVAPGPGDPNVVAPAQTSTANGPWYSRLWQSIVIADTTLNAPDAPASSVPDVPSSSASPKSSPLPPAPNE